MPDTLWGHLEGRAKALVLDNGPQRVPGAGAVDGPHRGAPLREAEALQLQPYLKVPQAGFTTMRPSSASQHKQRLWQERRN